MKTIPPKVQDLFQRLYELVCESAEADVMGRLTDAFRRPNGQNGAPSRSKPAKVFKAKGAKRSPEQIALQTDQVMKWIAGHPETRAEEIADGTGIATGDLPIIVKRLLAEKKIKAAGVARGTKYSAR